MSGIFESVFCLDAGWFRVFGHGLAYTWNPPLFSERNGYRRPFMSVFGYRFFVIGPRS